MINLIGEKRMNCLIIGDIHGCYYTFSKLLKSWNKEQEVLVLVGNLIDRGNYSAKVVKKGMKLMHTYENIVILKGNHEAELIQYIQEGTNDNWTSQGGDLTLLDFEDAGIHYSDMLAWLMELPLYYETPHFMVTHAGITTTENPFLEAAEDSVVWNRKALRNIGKLQIHGHTPLLSNQAHYNPRSNSWNIDTGAYYGFGLTAIRIENSATIHTLIHIPTDQRDCVKINKQ